MLGIVRFMATDPQLFPDLHPKNPQQLKEMGWVDGIIRVVVKEVTRLQREYWLGVLQGLEAKAIANGDPDTDPDLIQVRKEIKSLRRKLGLYSTAEELRARDRARVARYQAKKQAETTPTVAAGEPDPVGGDVAGARLPTPQ